MADATDKAAFRQGDFPRRWLVAWCLYDWGNSSFPAIILSFVLGPYFAAAVAADNAVGTALWGNALTLSALIIAVLSPFVGAFCDRGGRRKAWLGAFTVPAVVATAAMWWVAPTPESVVLALLLLVVANTAFEMAYVFYNGMLPEIVPPRRVGRASGWGWGAGYVGGIVVMAIAWVAFIGTDDPPFGLDPEDQENVRATFVLAALWYAVFALPLFATVPDNPASGIPARAVVREGIATVLATLRRLPQNRSVMYYLIAHMLYIDGLNTLFVFGGIYAAGTFGMALMEVLMFGIGINVAAGLGAIAFAWVDDRIGPRRVILVSVAALIVLTTAALFVESKTAFMAVGLMLGAFFGPVQASSRSLMARLAPAAQRSEMFGLYSLAGKATAFLGPLLVGWVTLAAGSQRVGLAVIVVFLAAGLALLVPVKEPPAGG